MTPLQRATKFKADDKLVSETAKRISVSPEEARALLDNEIANEEIWVNEIYQVAAHRFEHHAFGPCMQINIRRRDGNVIFRDWRHFQEIKNQLAGPECEAIELYPAESRLVDTSNKYHLWAVLNPQLRIPFGWDERDVSDDNKTTLPGHRQRKLPKGWTVTPVKGRLRLPSRH